MGCQNSTKTKKEKSGAVVQLTEKPSRTPYAGYEWEKVSGAGIEFWAQRSDSIQVGISETLPGAFVEKIENGKPVALELVIQVFDLKNKKIEDVFDYLTGYYSWDENEKCSFTKIETDRADVDRYILMPSGEALRNYEKQSQSEPVLSTCGGWGLGNSGARYFEIHHNNPGKALFIELGQEEPLFEPESIIVK